MYTLTRDGREPEPSKNEPNQNPRFAKNQTLPEPYVYRTQTEHQPNFLKVVRTRTEPNPNQQRTPTEQWTRIVNIRFFPASNINYYNYSPEIF